jgi:hypothetical protein
MGGWISYVLSRMGESWLSRMRGKGEWIKLLPIMGGGKLSKLSRKRAD